MVHQVAYDVFRVGGYGDAAVGDWSKNRRWSWSGEDRDLWLLLQDGGYEGTLVLSSRYLVLLKSRFFLCFVEAHECKDNYFELQLYLYIGYFNYCYCCWTWISNLVLSSEASEYLVYFVMRILRFFWLGKSYYLSTSFGRTPHFRGTSQMSCHLWKWEV